MAESLPADYFDRLYAADSDPWRISTGWYEQRKRALSLAVLPAERYDTVVELGSGNGDLTVALALRCDRLIALEGAETAVRTAAQRTAGLPHVEVRHGRIPQDWTDTPADLFVLSEIGYYLSDVDLSVVAERIRVDLRPGGTLLAVHWRHDAPGYPQTGDEVHAVLSGTAGLTRLGGYDDRDVLIDVFTPSDPPPRSVAQVAGVVE